MVTTLWQSQIKAAPPTLVGRSEICPAGVGAGARPRLAALCRDRALRARPRAALRLRGADHRLQAGAGRRRFQTGRRAGRRQRHAGARRCHGSSGRAWRLKQTARRAAAVRLRRRDRRDQRRQVDARQRAGRRQGHDRLAQGADDAHAGCAASPWPGQARSCSSTRPASSRRAAGSTGRWSMRPGAALRRPTSTLLLVDAAKAPGAALDGILGRLGDTRAPMALVLNKVDRVDRQGGTARHWPRRCRRRQPSRPSSWSRR